MKVEYWLILILGLVLLTFTCTLFSYLKGYDAGFDSGWECYEENIINNYINGSELYSRITSKMDEINVSEHWDARMYQGAELARKEILKMMEEKKK